MDILRISSLQASHIGPFDEIGLQFPEKVNKDLAEIHIFSGENGTGKSTLLAILSAFHDHCRSLIPKVHRTSSDKISLAVNFNLKHNDLAGYSPGGFSYTYTKRGWGTAGRPPFLTDYDAKVSSQISEPFSFAFFAYSGYRRLTTVTLGAIQELNIHPLKNALDFGQSIDPKLLLQWIANTKTKEALSLAKGDTLKANQYHIAITKTERIISEITDLSIKFEMEDNPLAVSIIVENTKLQFGTLPDGLKSIISWISDLLMRMDRLPWQDNIDVFDRNFILFLDEIEVHLHPKWQRKILPIIQKLFKNAQIFISTHSPFVLGSIDNAWIYKFEKEGMFSKLALPPFLSEDAKSYRMILEEIFDINKQFGVEVEKQLDRFYQLKNEILRGDHTNLIELHTLIKSLASQSNELESIIGMEIRQIKKLKGEQFEIQL